MRKTIIILLVISLFSGLVMCLWQAVLFFKFKPNIESAIVFDVPPGQSFRQTVQMLAKNEIIHDARYFRWYARLTQADRKLKIGEFEVSPQMGPKQILQLLTNGPQKLRTFTVPEGTHMYDIATIIASSGLGNAEEYLKLFKDPSLAKRLLGETHESLEGYLFPDTYSFNKYTQAEEVVRVFVDRFFEVYREVEANQPQRSALNRHQIVTLASIIEKETGAPFERNIISAVFHNRLKIGMRLQTDPTILYGILDETGVMKKNITKKDIQTRTRFNTYKINGLPPAPIASPGKESLKAALEPIKSSALYFVSKNDGTHIFSSNLTDHNKAVREFQLDNKARKGKSWRDLKAQPKGS